MKEPTACEKCGRVPVPPDFIFVGWCGECTRAQKAKYAPKQRPHCVDDEYPAGYRIPASRACDPDEGEWYRDRL